MGQMRTIVIVIFAGALAAAAVWVCIPPQQPSYFGKPLSYWLNQQVCGDRAELALETIRAAGTNAVPFIMDKLRTQFLRNRRGPIELTRSSRVADTMQSRRIPPIPTPPPTEAVQVLMRLRQDTNAPCAPLQTKH